jgi:hypothetical protein
MRLKAKCTSDAADAEMAQVADPSHRARARAPVGAPADIVSNVRTMTGSTWSSEIVLGKPGLGSSNSPSDRSSR